MKDIFMCLLLNLVHHGKITEANLYKGGTCSTITLKNEEGIYKVSVIKEETERVTNGND